MLSVFPMLQLSGPLSGDVHTIMAHILYVG
jgi:hypothetical protein